METTMKKFILAAVFAAISTGAMAGGNFQQGGSGPFDVKSAMLAIKSPATNACPANAKLKAWIYTTKAGPVRYMMIRHGQGAGPIQTVMAKKINGKYVARDLADAFHSPQDRREIPDRGARRGRLPVLELGAAESELHDPVGWLTHRPDRLPDGFRPTPCEIGDVPSH
jgi:hypothetical protein